VNGVTAQDVVTLIQTVGFPIVMCGAMAWYVKYISDKNREQITAEREAHKEEMNEVIKAINNNTIVIEKLIAKLDTPVITTKAS
jgi:L-asparaginase/Glu-tRNA(Gln) amidotransferase subunit D